jgi:tyrosyl-tRNA synthetase
VEETPDNMFGKTMSIPDSMLDRWFGLLTTIAPADRPTHPMEAKKALAHFITARFHGEQAATEAREAFEARFSKREIPTDLPEITVHARALPDLIVEAGFASSKSEARRFIEQGGVKINGETQKIPQVEITLTEPFTLQVGKLKLAKIILS